MVQPPQEPQTKKQAPHPVQPSASPNSRGTETMRDVTTINHHRHKEAQPMSGSTHQ